jgi:hypothetical protein
MPSEQANHWLFVGAVSVLAGGVALSDAGDADPSVAGGAVVVGAAGVALVLPEAGGLVGVVPCVEVGRSTGALVDDPPPRLKASLRWSAQKYAMMLTAIQIEAVTIVIRVNTSPAFAPNALEPPMPPSAPASPPPRPRCTRTSRIRKMARKERSRAKNALMLRKLVVEVGVDREVE